MMSLIDRFLGSVGLVRTSLVEEIPNEVPALVVVEKDDTEVVKQETETMSREGFKVVQCRNTLVAIKEAALAMRTKHGRWPTHITLAAWMSRELFDAFKGTLVRDLPLTAPHGQVWIAYREDEHKVVSTPGWLGVEVVEPVVEVVAEPAVASRLASLDPVDTKEDVEEFLAEVAEVELVTLTAENREEVYKMMGLR
jgi:hypothetical protein